MLEDENLEYGSISYQKEESKGFVIWSKLIL